MSGDEDDKATVVIDISALKKQKEMQDQQLSDMAGSLEFASSTSDDVKTKSAVPVFLFDFGQGFFESQKASLGSLFEYRYLKDLPQLNTELKKKTPLVVMFYFDANPKAANQLCAQLRAKFPHAKTVVVAKNLSEKKVQIHRSSPAGASGYISLPLEVEKVTDVLESIVSKIAS